MNKEQLIVKLYEIEPNWNYHIVNTKHGLTICIETFKNPVWDGLMFWVSKNLIETAGESKDTDFFAVTNLPKILTVAQQYFKGNENENISNIISDNKTMKKALEIIASDGKEQFDWTPTKCWYFAENTLKSLKHSSK